MNAQSEIVRPYAPPSFAQDLALDLSKNEGRAPMGMPSLPESLALARYPDLSALRLAMAKAFGAEPERVLVTAGGDDALLRVCLARLGAGRTAVLCEPTFEMIPRYVRIAGGSLRSVAWSEGPFPIDAVLAAAQPTPSVVFVVSPNNPTGAVATADDVRRLSRALPRTLLVLDLAYEEFADEPLSEVARELPNALVVRTLSKAWSLAGLRVGAAIGQPELLLELAAAGNPMPVSIASAALAIARLETGVEEMADHVEMVRQQRRKLVALCSALDLSPAEPTQGNFVLVRGVDARRTASSFAALGVGVRRFPDDANLTGAVRIALPGTDEGFARLAHAMTSTFAPEALLFDMDGVLADVRASYRTAIVRTAESFGVTLHLRDVAAAKARGNCNDDWQLTQDLLRERGVDVPLETVVDRFESIYQPLSVLEQPMVSREQLLRWRSRRPLGVVTGRPRADAERFLARFSFADCFDVVVCREDAALKPDPAPVRLALQRLAVRTAWMLGDTVDDVRAAQGALVLPIGVLADGDLPGAAFTLRATPDLDSFLP
jgi:histidinol-phosphate aminotransferase